LVDEIRNTLDISHRTIVKIKDNQLELIDGDLNDKPWVVLDEDENLNILQNAREYIEVHQLLEKLIEENFELKLEKAILTRAPKDYEDVKAVVLEEMRESGNEDIEETIESIQKKHPNLFLNFSFDDLIQVIK
jgi:regulator of replication initiation timing